MARTPRQIEDERLALRCRLGEPAAFAELVETMERPLLYFARSIVHNDEAALDVLQAVWMTAFRGAPPPGRPGGAAIVALPGHARPRRRPRPPRHRAGFGRTGARRRERARSHRPTTGPGSTPRTPRCLHRSLATLDVRHREVLVLHFLEDMPVDQVAAVVGCPPGTVKSRIYHAKRALKEALLRHGHGQ